MWAIIAHKVGGHQAEYLPRLLTGRVERALEAFPVVVLTGARQTGKTTLVQRLGGARRYLTLETSTSASRPSSRPTTSSGGTRR